MASQTPIAEFDSLLSNSEMLFVVFYRGHWCPFCQAWLRDLQAMSPSVASMGGKTVAITAQPAEFLSQMRERSGYSGDAIVDTENTLVPLMKERYELEVAITERAGYAHGMAQPAVLVLRGGKASGGKEPVLEKWAIVPSTMNIGGAKDRPELQQVWENARAQFQGQAKEHQQYTTKGFSGLLWGWVFG
ncbi:hypothetical protein LTR97_012627 [Elasticomyces elasticus]|uniref:Alkyl hydroperoxide reductase subunit C/ Thiol specific antioxidant domain-containing protein n=1 Tax=Elasticomyces elasticus TaxID=574655 RepID=A0AAN7ZKJ9_9PEZI|nr:hypothetical protein LTR97_012627 [Elasticomyces elasticus]